MGRESRAGICAIVDELGATRAIEDLQRYADRQQGERGVEAGAHGIDVIVLAWLPHIGGTHRLFRSYDQEVYARPGERIDAAKRRPYDVFEPRNIFWSGSPVKAKEFTKLGLDLRPDEDPRDCTYRLGIDLMHAMRFRTRTGFNNRRVCCVGWKIDFTVFGPDGAFTKTVVEWPDQVGCPNDPFRGMSRAERGRIQAIVA